MKKTLLVFVLIASPALAKNPDQDSVEIVADLGSIYGPGNSYTSFALQSGEGVRINDSTRVEMRVLTPHVTFIKPATDHVTVLLGFNYDNVMIDSEGKQTDFKANLSGVTARVGFRYYFDK